MKCAFFWFINEFSPDPELTGTTITFVAGALL